jgi:3-methyladenine DNA glycosylase AlkD
MKASDAKQALEKFANADDAAFLQRFFKTGAGEYGEGDVFIGVRVPKIRLVAREFRELPQTEVQQLLDSPVHEHRMCAAIILTLQFARARKDENTRRKIYEMYLQNAHDGRINNWDLVDVTTPRIVGEYLADKPHDILLKLANSKSVWERRVAVISTFAFLKRGDPGTSLQIAEVLLRDPHDLIQKTVGWMLREVGKSVDRQLLTDFLSQHAHEMPRTMLRYALEHLQPELRQKYLSQKTPV